jgi:hypothetical protein
MIGRRQFITLLGGAATWPLSARAQQRERMRRVGVLMPTPADDLEGRSRVAAFRAGLRELAGGKAVISTSIIVGPRAMRPNNPVGVMRADGGPAHFLSVCGESVTPGHGRMLGLVARRSGPRGVATPTGA